MALASANTIIADLLESASDLESAFTLVTFAAEVHVPIYDHQPVAQVRPLAPHDYRPNGRTALFDAIGTTVTRLRTHSDAADQETRFAVHVVTDGRENHSALYTGSQIRAMIRELEATGRWTFHFYGAFDGAQQDGETMGFNKDRVRASGSGHRGRAASFGHVEREIRDDIANRRHRKSRLSVAEAIPDLARLVDAVEARNTNKGSHCHAQPHWRGVAWTALQLLHETPGADPAVALLFAVFHDSQRRHDGGDRQHGIRGAALAREMRGAYFHLSDRQWMQLEDACARHTGGVLPLDATVALCWDSDRLNLWRVRTVPNPARLCLPASRRPERIEWARSLNQQNHSWEEIYQAFLEYDRCNARRMFVP